MWLWKTRLWIISFNLHFLLTLGFVLHFKKSNSYTVIKISENPGLLNKTLCDIRCLDRNVDIILSMKRIFSSLVGKSGYNKFVLRTYMKVKY